MSVLSHILNFSECWMFLIPIISLHFNKQQPEYLQPVIIYVFVAFYLNFLTDLIYYSDNLHFPRWFSSNIFLYHFHSIIRFCLFSVFFIRLKQPFLKGIKKLIPILFLAFVSVNFTTAEKLVNLNFDTARLSHHLLAVEASFLLAYCLLYYLFRLQEDQQEKKKPSHFWVVTGLCIFVVPCIPVYIFYGKAVENDIWFAMYIWKFINLCYLILCIMIAKAFAQSKYNV